MVLRSSAPAAAPAGDASRATSAAGEFWWPWSTTVSNYTALLSTRSWLAPDGDTVKATPIFLTYSFQTHMTAADRDAFDGPSSHWKAFSRKDRADARSALKKWGAASGITFLETKGDHGDIQFSWTPQKDTSGLGYYPDAETLDGNFDMVSHFTDISGNIYLNVHDRDRMAKDRAFKKYVLLHEIGHALGLKHPFDENFFNARTLNDKYDSVKYTVMAYKSDFERSPTVLKTFDIQAIRKLYGSHKLDGKQVAAWGWDKKTETLAQIGKESADKLWGANVSDRLYGNGGDDRLNGLAGDDLLVGGSGGDTLIGGSGQDTFRFDVNPRKEASVDRILDFEPFRDRIELAATAFSDIGPAGGLNPAKFLTGRSLTEKDVGIRIIVEEDGTLSYDPDGGGPSPSLTIATITTTTGLAINAGHFLVI